MAVTQEPILSRLDRLDNLMRHLEEIKGSSRSPKSSSPSTPSSATARTSCGHDSSLDFSPRSRDRDRDRDRDSKLQCRPIDDVIEETEHKGTLLDRVARMEDRLLQVEEEIEAEKHEREEKSPHHKKGLKQLVKSCVKGKPKSKNKSSS